MAGNGAADDEATGSGASPMVYGEGQSAWLALVTVVAFGALALAIVAVVLASGDDGGGDGAAPAPSGPSDALSITVTEFAFDPADSEVFADQEASVALVNEGAVEHNWTVLQAGTFIASEDEFDESLVEAEVGDAAAGGSAEGAVTLAEGEYQVICTISGHFDAGMQGTVVAGA
jgi:plastocyanin